MTNTTTKNYMCEMKVVGNNVEVKSPSGSTVKVTANQVESQSLKEIIESFEFTQNSFFPVSLTRGEMIELKEISERKVIAQEAVRKVLIPEVVEGPVFPAVSSRPTFFKTGGVFKLSPSHRSIVNLDTGDTYAVVSDRYQLLKHEEAIQAVEEALDENGLNDYKKEIQIEDDGSLIIVNWTFNDIKEEAEKGDLVSPSVRMINSYNTSRSFWVSVDGKRLVCLNGMTASTKLASYRKKHTKSLDIDAIKEVVISGIENFKEQVSHWSQWTKEVVDQKMLDQVQDVFTKKDFKEEVLFLREVSTNQTISDNIRIVENEEEKEVFELASQNFNKWIFYNICTQFITHHIQNKNKKLKTMDALGKVFK